MMPFPKPKDMDTGTRSRGLASTSPSARLGITRKAVSINPVTGRQPWSSLRSNPEKTRAWQRKSRKPLPTESARRKRLKPKRRVARETVMERDNMACQLRVYALRVDLDYVVGLSAGQCFGEVTAHEILPRGRAMHVDETLTDIAGIVCLCARHNTWASSGDPALAERIGLLLKSDDRHVPYNRDHRYSTSLPSGPATPPSGVADARAAAGANPPSPRPQALITSGPERTQSDRPHSAAAGSLAGPDRDELRNETKGAA